MSKFFTTELSFPENEFFHLRFLTVKSKSLAKRADITVFIPPVSDQVLDVVILLHGVYGSHWAWAMNGGVHKTANALIQQGKMRPMVLVMPSDGLYGDGSGYLPHRTENYEKWIVEDVIEVVKEQFPVVNDQSQFFITGLSMGGYGAMRLGASYPDVFRSFSGLSSITEFAQLSLFLEEEDFRKLKQDTLTQESVLECILSNREKLLHFYFDCGTEDLLIDYNRKLHHQLIEHNIPHTYKEHPGAHQWVYWQNHIADSLLFFNNFKSNVKQ